MALGMILAAGRGARLGADMPKALIPWGDAALVDLQLDLLARAGVKDVWLVVGFRSDLLRAHVAPRWPSVRFVENPRHLDAQNGKSFLVGMKALPPGGFVAVNSDVAFD